MYSSGWKEMSASVMAICNPRLNWCHGIGVATMALRSG